jgi:hypothetical protein
MPQGVGGWCASHSRGNRTAAGADLRVKFGTSAALREEPPIDHLLEAD